METLVGTGLFCVCARVVFDYYWRREGAREIWNRICESAEKAKKAVERTAIMGLAASAVIALGLGMVGVHDIRPLVIQAGEAVKNTIEFVNEGIPFVAAVGFLGTIGVCYHRLRGR